MKKILVIDDDSAMMALTTRALRARGFQTLAAHNGVVGLEMAKQHLPDLIICDIQMPQLNGYETLAALRQDSTTATIPFIFLTGMADRKQIRQGMGLGADDYLTKPFTVQELIGAVTTRLEKQGAVQRRSEKKLEDLRGNIGMALPHELLTPLNGILGLASIMADAGAVFRPDEIREFAQNIHVSAQRLHRIIENFIIFSEMELAKSDPKKMQDLRASPPAATREIVLVVAREKAAAAERQEDLSLEAEEACVVMGAGYFKKIIEELVDNAFKFSEPRTPVRVTAGVSGKRFALSVSDRGRGMSAQQVADIGAHMQFERRFYEQQGIGLGLIISRGLAEMHGGELLIDSTPGQHTTVELLLPLAAPTN
jgi:two-component system, sensor histidine kinase and response regulator